MCWNSSPILNNCCFRENSANYGGGVASFGDSVTLTHCIFEKNYVFSDTWPDGGWGGGMYCHSSSVTSTNCTLGGNGNPWTGYHCYGGGLYLVHGSMSMENCIIAFSSGSNAVDGVDCDPSMLCCDIYGNEYGDWVDCIADQTNINGNFSADPQFCDAASSDFSIHTSSPCAALNNACNALIGAIGVGCASCCVGITGNIDGDTEELVDIGDVTALVAYLYVPPHQVPTCLDEANTDGDPDRLIDLGDLTRLIAYLYIPPNPPPAACQ